MSGGLVEERLRDEVAELRVENKNLRAAKAILEDRVLGIEHKCEVLEEELASRTT